MSTSPEPSTVAVRRRPASGGDPGCPVSAGRVTVSAVRGEAGPPEGCSADDVHPAGGSAGGGGGGGGRCGSAHGGHATAADGAVLVGAGASSCPAPDGSTAKR